ncbi:hypothetical protein FQN54_004457 [Arachnomyces sp. PD_36]|nr:hypothetical protein FQN54_004457 [Arachnomyces sp. PD_36]
METPSILPLIEQLEYDIDDLEEALQPLLQNSLSAITQKLPVLDKAKLYVLLTYAIESLIFSYLRLNGVNAKEHPIYKELTRVKQYFQKIKDLETPAEKPTMALDKQAAGRFIKHGLAGNDKYDLERAEREAKEKAMAQLKAAQLAKKMASAGPSGPTPRKRGAEEMSSSNSAVAEEDDDEVMTGLEAENGAETAAKPPVATGRRTKKPKWTKAEKAAMKQKKMEKKKKNAENKEKRKQKKKAQAAG